MLPNGAFFDGAAALHFLLALRKVYRERWWVTLLKFSGVGLCYLLIFTLAMLATVLVSMLS